MPRSWPFGVLAWAVACRPGPPSAEPPDQPASPQAKAEPAPIVILPAANASASPPSPLAVLDGGVVAQPLRTDRAVSGDMPPRETTKDGVAGYTLTAFIRADGVAPPPKGIDPTALEAARKKAEPHLVIDAAPGHARMVLGSGFLLPEGTELLQRIDRYGHVIVLPDEGTYRVAAPGALRAVLGERRLDVAPASPAEVTHNGEGPRRFGRPTHKVTVVTRAAMAAFELVHLADVADGGPLVCRSLLELIGAPATTPLCSEGDVPARVDLHWTSPPAPVQGLSPKGRTAGTLVFEVTTITRRADLSPSSLMVPPPQATFTAAPFPPAATQATLTRPELVALHAPGPEASLALVNATDELRFVLLEGVAVTWVAPGQRVDLAGLPSGRYAVQWRTFLGDAIEPPQTVSLPATAELGGAEAAQAL